MSPVLAISPGSDVPIYRQIAQQIRAAIARRQLRTGEQLPAMRPLAEELVVNPNTVARAYQELVRDGLVESRSGVGLFVLERRQIFSAEERARRLGEAVEQLFHEALILDFPLAEVQALLEKKWHDFPSPSRSETDPERKKK
jgi:GntR family transcriptional regulator